MEFRRPARALAAALPALVLLLGVPIGAEEPADASAGSQEAQPPVVELQTSKGAFRIALKPDEAPVTTRNFLQYVESGFYDGTVFHRVIPGFMIQGGGFTSDMEQKKTRAAIENEADNGLKNLRGTLAMARTQDKDSATAQFFVNLTDNAFLDHGARDFGYAVFAEVVDGMDVVDRIAEVETGRRGPHGDVPVEPVVIESARVVEGSGSE